MTDVNGQDATKTILPKGSIGNSFRESIISFWSKISNNKTLASYAVSIKTILGSLKEKIKKTYTDLVSEIKTKFERDSVYKFVARYKVPIIIVAGSLALILIINFTTKKTGENSKDSSDSETPVSSVEEDAVQTVSSTPSSNLTGQVPSNISINSGRGNSVSTRGATQNGKTVVPLVPLNSSTNPTNSFIQPPTNIVPAQQSSGGSSDQGPSESPTQNPQGTSEDTPPEGPAKTGPVNWFLKQAKTGVSKVKTMMVKKGTELEPVVSRETKKLNNFVASWTNKK